MSLLSRIFFALLLIGIGSDLLYSQGYASSEDSIRNKDPDKALKWFEEIYIHTDRDFYVTGETIWFKVYLLNKVDRLPSQISRVVYIELFNSYGQQVVQEKIMITKGF